MKVHFKEKDFKYIETIDDESKDLKEIRVPKEEVIKKFKIDGATVVFWTPESTGYNMDCP